MSDRRLRRAQGAALTLVLLAAPSVAPAVAQDLPELTTAQRTSLDQALQLWLGGASVPLAASPDASVVAEGDHYRLTRPVPLPAGSLGALSVTGGTLTANVRPLDAGRWEFRGITVATPFTIHATLPKQGSNPGGDLDLTFEAPAQDWSATLDPTLATPSSSSLAWPTLRGSLHMAPDVAATFRGGPLVVHGGWEPAGSGRVDRDSQASLNDLSVDVAGKQKVSIAIHRLASGFTLKGLSPDRLTQLMQRLRAAQTSLLVAPNATGSKVKSAADLTPAQRDLARGLVAVFRDLATAIDVRFSAEDIAVSGADHLVRLRKVAVAEGLSAPAGRTDAFFRLTVEGLDSPDIPAAIAKDYMPHRLVLAPRVTGLSTDALFHLIDDALAVPAPSSQVMQAEGEALLARGPVSVGLDELSFDIGPTLLTATGAMQVAGRSPQDVTGSAVIRAKHFDLLMQRASSDPMLQQAGPVLIFLKGIGEADAQGGVTWKVAYADGKMLVNGTDLSQMLPHH